MALIAIPANSMYVTENPPVSRVMRKISTQVAKPPQNAATAKPYRPNRPDSGPARTITMATASAAPLEIPISPGSANGLRNRPCNAAPDTANAAPTTTDNSTRGRRMVRSTASC